MTGQTVRPATLNTVTAAAKAGGEVHVLVVGHNAADAANEAAKIGGVSKVLLADGAQFADGLAEPVAAQVVSMAGGYSHLFAAATAYGKNIMPRVAAKLDAAQISDISSVESADTFTRPIYAGNAIATVQSGDPIKVVTARPTNFEPAPSEGGSATVETVAAVAAGDASRFVSRDVVKLDRPELQGAKIVDFRRPRHRLGGKFQVARAAGGQAECGDRCIARRGRCRLCPKRLAGRANGQGRGAAAVYRGRHLGRDSASGRHEGLEGDRGDQQGRGGADLPDCRLRAGR